tara:strand:- start:9253 stop:9675 length:423 start_codon:yes stop_codon:yes gene_type:complete
VSEQFLNGAEVAAVRQQVRREAVPQCVWRCSLGQPQHSSKTADLSLNNARVEPTPALADKQGIVITQLEGAMGEIVLNGVMDDPQHRDHALLVTLSGYDKDIPLRDVTPVEGESLRDAKATAVEQGQNGRIPFPQPTFVL